MDLIPTSEQDAIVAATADVMRGEFPVARLHRADAHLLTSAQRRQMAELGWFGMSLPESQGGVGLGVAEEALVVLEIGRHLGPTAVLHTAIAARVAAAAGSPLLQGILAGTEPVALLVAAGPVAAAAESASGLRGHLYDFEGARLALCLAADDALLLDLEHATIERGLPCWDRSLAMARLAATDLPVLARQDAALLRPAAELLSAAMLLGIAEAVRDMLVEYARIRQTFGRPIGSNQAVRHPCADMAARCEMARAQLYYAAISLRDGLPGASVHAASARVLAQHAAMANVDANIQLHGGIGVTDEHDAHLYLKRAHVLSTWYGSAKSILPRILAAPVPAL